MVLPKLSDEDQQWLEGFALVLKTGQCPDEVVTSTPSRTWDIIDYLQRRRGELALAINVGRPV